MLLVEGLVSLVMQRRDQTFFLASFRLLSPQQRGVLREKAGE